MASPLDVFAALGSTRAQSILDANPDKYNFGGWEGYASTRKALTSELAATPASAWRQDLYGAWFAMLKTIFAPAASSSPAFMRSQAWQDMRLDSALASWTELKHDTVLYGLQPEAAEMGDGDEPPPPFVKGYVEPNLPFCDRLLEAIRQMRLALKSRGYLTTSAKNELASFEDFTVFFRHCASSELAGKPLSKEDHLRIRHAEGELSEINVTLTEMGVNYQRLSPDDSFMALITDVATANSDVLECGVGGADHLIAVVPIEGKLYLARGTVFSYYEMLHPSADRMTDGAWKKMLRDGEPPERPFWTSSYFVNAKSE